MTQTGKRMGLGCMLLYLSQQSCTASLANPQEVEVKISNRMGTLWIWIQVNGGRPIKIQRSQKCILRTHGENELRVYSKDPSRSTQYQLYYVTLAGAGLHNLKYGLEIRKDHLVYRSVGKDGIVEKKEKKEIWPINDNNERTMARIIRQPL